MRVAGSQGPRQHYRSLCLSCRIIWPCGLSDGLHYVRRKNQVMDKSPDTKHSSLPLKQLRQVVSLGALFLALAHIIWPRLAIDAVALALIVIAILPWLAPLVKSLELPGGWKVEFQELQKAASRAETAGLLAAEPSQKEAAFSFQSIATRDPNLALAGLRIEIEKRLSSLAEIHGLNARRPMGVGQSLRALAQAEVLTNEERSILSDMVNMLNSAVHGAEVDTRAAAWAIDVGPRLLTSLDERVIEAQRLTNHSTGPAQKPAQSG